MAYTITNSRLQTVTTIADGTVNTSSTPLTLIGKNYINYGTAFNQNLVRMLENFAKATAPATPATGQLWYDIGTSSLKFYDGTMWRGVGVIAPSSGSAPSSPNVGDCVWDTSQFKVWNGLTWVVIGPTTGSLNLDGPITALYMTATNSISAPYGAFGNITIAGNTGTISIAGAGTVSSNIGTFNYLGGTITTPAQPGITTVGMLASLVVTGNVGGTLSTVAQPYVQSLGTLNSLSVAGTTTLQTVAAASNNVYNIGSLGAKFATIYATTFNGVATQAQYADLAERYEADTQYAIGTLMMVGGMKEVTQVDSVASDDVWGVISYNPAFLMNSEAGTDDTHPPVALVGKIPVRVVGSVNKGDPMISAGMGVARSAQTPDEKLVSFGRALEDNCNASEKLVLVSIK